jgi:hypothetical protein
MFFSPVLYPSADCNLTDMHTKLFIKNGKAMDRRQLADLFKIKLLPSYLKVPINNRTLRQVLKLFGEHMSYTLEKVAAIMESLRQQTNSLMNHTNSTGINNYWYKIMLSTLFIFSIAIIKPQQKQFTNHYHNYIYIVFYQ